MFRGETAVKRVLMGLGAAVLAATAAVAPWNVPAPSGPPGQANRTGQAGHADGIEDLISPWCSGVAVTVRPGSGGRAGYSVSSHPVFGMAGTPEEYIEVGDAWPTGHPAATAVALHECAHILQYRAYGHDYAAVEAAMDRVYPDGPSTGVEHMADCISEVLGAVRTGRDAEGRTYVVGYGGDCTDAQRTAAERIVAGHQV
jgi:hypothetical protein